MTRSLGTAVRRYPAMAGDAEPSSSPGILDAYRSDPAAAVYLLSVASMAAILMGFAVHTLPLWGDEGVYGPVAKCTLMTGDWVTMHIGPHCLAFFSKGPVFIAALALSIKLFGPTEAALRLPNVLATIGITMLTYHLVLHVTRDAVRAAIAALILMTTHQMALHHRYALSDPLIIFFLTLGITVYVVDPDRRRALFLVGVLSMLPMLIKPVFPALLLIAVVIHLAITGRSRALSAPLWLGVAVGAALLALWNAYEFRRFGPAFLWEYWGIGLLGTGDPAAGIARPGERALGFVTSIVPKYYDNRWHVNTPFFYPLWLGLFYHPWLALLPVAVARVWSAKVSPDQCRFGLFAVVWIAVVLLVLSAARWRSPTYLLMVYPALAALIATFVDVPGDARGERVTGWLLAALVAFKLGQLAYVAATPDAVLPAGWRFELALTAICLIVAIGWFLRQQYGRRALMAAGAVAWTITAGVYLSLVIRPQADMSMPRLRTYAASGGRPVVLFAPDDWLGVWQTYAIRWYFDGLVICRDASCVADRASDAPLVLSTNDGAALRSLHSIRVIAKFEYLKQLDEQKELIAPRDLYALEFTSGTTR
jgi:4-amino-4-deoxy-L-arabinose transferase-like glycosyltransferase